MTISINPFMNAAAAQGYAHTNQLSKVTLNNDEISIATRGMTFTQPDWLPDGLNQTTGGAFGGMLNFITAARYDENGLPPQATKSWIG